MKQERQTTTSLALSIAVHLVVGAVLVRVLTYPLPLDDLFVRERGSEPPIEHVSFIAVPSRAAVTTPGRSGGDGRPVGARPTRLRAPTTVPPQVPAVVPAAPAAPEGSGEVIGAGGPEQGIRPSYSDPRLWVPPAPFVSAPKTSAARLDSSLTARLRAHRDSVQALAHVPSKMESGDWTMERNGQKYGIDQKFIHLGKFQLPTAALALLPFNQQANPIASERERRYTAMHAEIWEQAQRAMNYDEFRNAAKAIRERKDRERAAARQSTVAAENR